MSFYINIIILHQSGDFVHIADTSVGWWRPGVLEEELRPEAADSDRRRLHPARGCELAADESVILLASPLHPY